MQKSYQKEDNDEEIRECTHMERERERAYYNAMCSTVVAASDCPEPFLSCSIPLHVSEEKKAEVDVLQ